MRLMGLAGLAPGEKTSLAHLAHKIYPYLLRGVPVLRPNQFWSTDRSGSVHLNKLFPKDKWSHGG